MNIGGFELHAGVLWENELTTPAAAQQITRTVLDNIVVYQTPMSKHEMQIVARDSGNRVRGYFTREFLDYLRAAEASGATVVVQHRGNTYNTIVKAGGLDVQPKKEIENITSDDVYTGTITLQQI